MLNVLVPEIGLQGASVVPFVGQGITASVPKHVRVRLERQLGLPASPFDHAGEASRTKRCPAFRRKSDRTRVCPLLDQSGQSWILGRDGLSAYDPLRP
jgi:hypothetical protein